MSNDAVEIDPIRDNQLFFRSSDLIPIFPEVLLDLIYLLSGVVLHLNKRCPGSSVIGVGQISKAFMNGHPPVLTGAYPRGRGILIHIHPAGSTLRDVLHIDGYVFAPSFSKVTVMVLGMNANSTPGSMACDYAEYAEAMSAAAASVPRAVRFIDLLLDCAFRFGATCPTTRPTSMICVNPVFVGCSSASQPQAGLVSNRQGRASA